jgi:hypothetical protein
MGCRYSQERIIIIYWIKISVLVAVLYDKGSTLLTEENREIIESTSFSINEDTAEITQDIETPTTLPDEFDAREK